LNGEKLRESGEFSNSLFTLDRSATTEDERNAERREGETFSAKFNAND